MPTLLGGTGANVQWASSSGVRMDAWARGSSARRSNGSRGINDQQAPNIGSDTVLKHGGVWSRLDAS